VKAHFAPKQPEAKQKFSGKDKKWDKSFIEQPPQYKINLPSDYECKITKQSALYNEKKKQVQKVGNKFPSSENRKINRSPCS
jgi:hypothetical protein